MQIHSVEYMESCAPVVAICNFCQMPYYQQMLSRLKFFLAAHVNPAKDVISASKNGLLHYTKPWVQEQNSSYGKFYLCTTTKL